ncbi:MAG: cyclodeaminase/cyclohydrolase family protein [Deltaproteobacteria bacterium]|jgi:formiminotetrahydrofolate cyclodeaminase|nr:cyclodeaminase/cyclohydrolase family protein [Deltaproteobacteria bacterium]
MIEYQELYAKPFTEILELACSKSHVPGGGSVTAMSGALGASMGAMVANLTLNKKGYEDVYGEVEKLLDSMTSGIEKIKILTQQDMDAFDGVLLAYRLPKETDNQKNIRKEEIQNAIIKAAMVPLSIAVLANDLLFYNKRLSEIGNGSVVNDCAVACILLESTVRAAMLSVDVNFHSIEDKELKQEIKEKKDNILSESKKTMDETLAIVALRDKTL